MWWGKVAAINIKMHDTLTYAFQMIKKFFLNVRMFFLES
jgi:hypothetical protein